MKKIVFLASFVLFGLFISPVFAATLPSGGVLDFTVVRKGKDIGRHLMTFDKKDNQVDVSIETRVKVKVLMITAYHFDHSAKETWKNGKLTTMKSSTDDNGKKHRMKVTMQGTKLFMEADGTGRPVPVDIIPASLWNKTMVEQASVLNTLDGRTMKINVENAGEEILTVRGAEIKTDHYKIRGELQRDLWYTPSGLLVKVAFNGDDGTEVQYILK